MKKNIKLFITNIIALVIIGTLVYNVSFTYRSIKMFNYIQEKIDNTIGVIDMQLAFLDANNATISEMIEDKLRMIVYQDKLDDEIIKSTTGLSEALYYILDSNRHIIDKSADYLEIDFTESDYDNMDNSTSGRVNTDFNGLDITIDYIKSNNKIYVGVSSGNSLDIHVGKTWESLLSYDTIDPDVVIGAYDSTKKQIIYSPVSAIDGINIDIPVEAATNIQGTDGVYYIVRLYPYVDDIMLLTIIPRDVIKSQAVKDFGYLILLIIVVFILFNTYIVDLSKEKIDDEKSIKLIRRYFPESYIIKATSLAILLLATIFAIGILIITIHEKVRTSNRITSNNHALVMCIDEYDEYFNDILSNEQQAMTDITTKFVYNMLNGNEDLWNHSSLKELEKATDVKGISIYDLSGKVIATGSGYDNYTLPIPEDDASDTTKAILWNVLHGANGAITNAYKSADGEELVSIGMRMTDANESTCGMVEIAFDNKQYEHIFDDFDVNKYLTFFINDNARQIVSISKEDRSVVHKSRTGIMEDSFDDFPFATDEMLIDGYTGFTQINGQTELINILEAKNCYLILFGDYNMNPMYIVVLMIIITLICVPLFVAIAYTTLGQKQTLETKEGTEPVSTVEHLKKVISKIVFVYAVYIALCYLLSDMLSHETSVIWYVMHQKWERSPNIFAVCVSCMLVAILYAVKLIIERVIRLISKVNGTKGVTVAEVFSNILNFLFVVISIYVIALTLGFDPKAALASVGIASFIMGMGSQEMLRDIIAGISLISEKNFKIGDYMMFEGEIFEIKSIGLRSTVLDKCGQCKVVNNSRMTGIVNIMDAVDYANINITFGKEFTIEQIDEIINSEIPVMKQNIGPRCKDITYCGVENISGNGITVLLLLTTLKMDIATVKPELYREIALMMERRNVTVK